MNAESKQLIITLLKNLFSAGLRPQTLGVFALKNMTKLGYTWYPKDWGNSNSVFELTLIERGLYRELIDMAMLNDNKIIINSKLWARKFGSYEDEIESILCTLENLKLIKISGDELFIPSCESRLNLVRGGRNGGKKSKKNKPIHKPLLSLEEKNNKPSVKQIETKIEIENKDKLNINLIEQWFSDFENGIEITEIARINNLSIEIVKAKLNDFRIKAELSYPNYAKFVSHFKNWLNKNKIGKADSHGRAANGMVY